MTHIANHVLAAHFFIFLITLLSIMLHEIKKSFRFEAAHRLPNLPADHKCSRLHGHSFKVTLVLEGSLDPHYGWVQDAGEIKERFNPILKQLDHYYLNDITGLENPTAEILSKWIYEKSKPLLPLLKKIKVSETCTFSAHYPA